MDTGHCRELVGLVKLRSKGPAVFVGSIDAANLRLNVIVVHGSEMTPRERSLELKLEYMLVFVGEEKINSPPPRPSGAPVEQIDAG